MGTRTLVWVKREAVVLIGFMCDMASGWVQAAPDSLERRSAMYFFVRGVESLGFKSC